MSCAAALTPATAVCEHRQVIVTTDYPTIADDWRRLEETGHATVFQTRAWQEPLRRVLAPACGAEPLFVVARDVRTGAPDMLLPLCRRRDGWLNVVEFLDLGVCDYNAPLIAARFMPEREEFATLWRSIRAALPPGDMLCVDKSPALIGNAPNPLADLPGISPLRIGAWATALPDSRARYDAESLDRAFRKDLRRKRRRLAARGAVSFREARGRDDRAAMFAALVEMRSARFGALRRTDVCLQPAHRRFYDAVLARSPEGFARVFGLEVDGQLVAALFGLARPGVFSFLLSGFLEGVWTNASPGCLAVDGAIDQMIEEGVAVFDFTIGDGRQKRDFGAMRLPLYGGAEALGWRAVPYAARVRLKGALRTALGLSDGPWSA